MNIQKCFDPLLIHVNLHQQAKDKATSMICSEDMVDQKILQSDWLRTFWHIFQESTFPNMGFVQEHSK